MEYFVRVHYSNFKTCVETVKLCLVYLALNHENNVKIQPNQQFLWQRFFLGNIKLTYQLTRIL